MVRMREIAQACGVSKSTVSLAMNKPHLISKEKKDLILKKAKELGYFTDKDLAVKQILLVMYDFDHRYFDTYYNEVIFGIVSALKKDKIVFRIIDNFNLEYAELYKYEGVIFIGETPPEYLTRAKEYKLPFVLCGHPTNDNTIFSVRFDIENGIREILNYALSCGHKKIGLIVGRFKLQKYIEEIITNTFLNIQDINKKLVFSVDYDNLSNIQTGINQLLKLKATAIFCADDFLAYLTLKILKRQKLKVPNDISLMGFDGIEIPVYLENPVPYLTTVYTDRKALGQESVNLLKKNIIDKNISNKQIILPVTLRVGDSVKRL